MSKRLALVIGLACLLLSLGVLPRRASASAKVGSSAVHAALPAPSPTTSPTPSPLAFSLAGTHNASIPATLSSEEQQYQALLQQDSQQFPILAYQPLGNILDVLFDPGGRARILEGIQAVVREQDYCLNFDVPDPDQGEALCAAGEAADSAIAQMGLNLIVQQILDTAFGGVDVGLAGEVGLAAVESFVQDSTGGSLPKDEMEALSAQLLGAMYGHFGLQYIAGQLGSYTTDALLSLLSQENTTQAHLSQSLNTPFGNPVNVKVSYEYNPYTHYTTAFIATDRAAGRFFILYFQVDSDGFELAGQQPKLLSCSVSDGCGLPLPDGNPGPTPPPSPTSGLTVSSISPSSGPPTGGTTVEIFGANFSVGSSVTSVHFGGASATSVNCAATTECTATSPAGTGTVDVTVTVSGHTSTASAADRFTYGTTTVPCQANSWVGLPYLNRFYTGMRDLAGVCTTYVASQTFNSLVVTTNPTYMESDITINPGSVVTVGPGVTIQSSGGGWTVNGILSLGAGVTLQMAGGSAIYVHGASNGRSGGSLYAGGTADHPVTIASSRSTPAAGDWYGIAFWPGSSGTLDHIHLSDAGRGGMGLVGSNTCCYITAILLDGASPTISNSVIDHSAGNYVEVIHGSLPVLHDNHFTLPASGYGVTKKAGLLRRRSLTPPSMTGTLPVAHLV